MNNMRVMQVLLSDRIGGAETLARSLQAEWRAQGVICDLVYLDQNRISRFKRFRRVVGLRRAMLRFNPSIIVAHSALPIAYCRIAKPISVPIVDVLHSSGTDFSRLALNLFERLTIRRSAHAVAVSVVAANAYRRQIALDREITVIENGVSALPLGHRTDSDVTRIVTLARVAEEKRPYFWASVAAAFDNQDILFEWYGPYGEDRTLEAYVRDHERANLRGRFRGPTEYPGSVLANADILFHPSVREAQGVAIVEAVLGGVPVVCAASVAEGLIDGIVARVYDASSEVQSAVSAIHDLVNALGSEAALLDERKRAALTRYGMAKCAEAYLDVFVELT